MYKVKGVLFDAIQQMVEYLYTGQYKVPSSQDSNNKKNNAVSPLVFHARILDITNTYLIKGLQTLSVAEFKKLASRDVDDCALLRSVIDIYSLQYKSGKVLRNIVVKSVREQGAQGLNSRAGKVLDEITDQIPSFTKDLLHSLLNKPITGHCTPCQCGIDKRDQVPPVPSHLEPRRPRRSVRINI